MITIALNMFETSWRPVSRCALRPSRRDRAYGAISACAHIMSGGSAASASDPHVPGVSGPIAL